MKQLNKTKGKLLSFIVALFLLSLAGFGIGAMTGFKYAWLNAISFIMILPAINMWTWQWIEDKKGVNTANRMLIISIAISLFMIKYIIDKGSLGMIPSIIGFSLAALYIGWIAWTFISACDEIWKKK